ncbi:hypothetical protein AAE478_003571 [Parahypoxylon ruwenzoriense]
MAPILASRQTPAPPAQPSVPSQPGPSSTNSDDMSRWVGAGMNLGVLLAIIGSVVVGLALVIVFFLIRRGKIKVRRRLRKLFGLRSHRPRHGLIFPPIHTSTQDQTGRRSPGADSDSEWKTIPDSPQPPPRASRRRQSEREYGRPNRRPQGPRASGLYSRGPPRDDNSDSRGPFYIAPNDFVAEPISRPRRARLPDRAPVLEYESFEMQPLPRHHPAGPRTPERQRNFVNDIYVPLERRRGFGLPKSDPVNFSHPDLVPAPLNIGGAATAAKNAGTSKRERGFNFPRSFSIASLASSSSFSSIVPSKRKMRDDSYNADDDDSEPFTPPPPPKSRFRYLNSEASESASSLLSNAASPQVHEHRRHATNPSPFGRPLPALPTRSKSVPKTPMHSGAGATATGGRRKAGLPFSLSRQLTPISEGNSYSTSSGSIMDRPRPITRRFSWANATFEPSMPAFGSRRSSGPSLQSDSGGDLPSRGTGTLSEVSEHPSEWEEEEYVEEEQYAEEEEVVEEYSEKASTDENWDGPDDRPTSYFL